MSSIPATRKAFVLDNNKGSIRSIPIPKLKSGEALIKTEAVAINPTDWKHIDFKMGPDGAVIGCDVAGVVVAIADDVTAIKVGDQVSSFVSGSSTFHPENGAFAEYVLIKADRTIKSPVELTHAKELSLPVGPVNTWEGAASLPVGIFTASLAFSFYGHIPLEYNSKFNDQYFFVWGGASSLGQAVIQFAKFYGFKVITTASKHNFDILKELGAEKVFDYRESDVLEQITSYAGGDLTYGFDAISDPQTLIDTYSVLSKTRDSVLFVSLAFDESTIKEVNPKVKEIHFPLTYLTLDEKKQWGDDLLISPKGMIESAIEESAKINEVYAKDPLFVRHMPIKIIPGGLEAIAEALDIVRTGKNSGVKIVVPF